MRVKTLHHPKVQNKGGTYIILQCKQNINEEEKIALYIYMYMCIWYTKKGRLTIVT